MSRTRYFAALLAVLCTGFQSCKKGTEKPVSSNVEFRIEGARDVTLDNSKPTFQMPISVTYIPETPSTACVHVGELPKGIFCQHIADQCGMEHFNPTFNFAKLSSTIPGTYPITISAGSGSDHTSTTFNLTIPPINGWTYDDYDVILDYVTMQTTPDFYYLQWYGKEVSRLVLKLAGQKPVADGTYTYKIVDYNSSQFSQGEAGIRVDGVGDNLSVNSAPKVITLKVSNGKYSVVIPTVELENQTQGGRRILFSANASEQ